MGLSNLFKKKNDEVSQNITSLPPLPGNLAEGLPPLDDDISAKHLQKNTSLPSLDEATSPSEAPLSEEMTMDMLDHLLDELSGTTETPVQTPVQKSVVPSEKQTQKIQSTPPPAPVQEAPSFPTIDNYNELVPEEFFINKRDYILLLGNVDLLKKELVSEQQVHMRTEEYADLVKKGIQQGLDAQAVLTKVEETLSL